MIYKEETKNSIHQIDNKLHILELNKKAIFNCVIIFILQLSKLHQTFGLSNLRFLSELQTREMFLWLTHLEFLPGFYLCNWCNLSLVFASTMNRFWCVIDSIRLHRIHKYKLHSNNHSDFQLKSRFLVELTIQQDKKCCKQAQNSEQKILEFQIQ